MIPQVWRPTSSDAIRKMISGEGTGKGLDIKGKSAKCGAFSGFVPFMQIHDSEHKKKVGPMRSYHRVRVFYPNRKARDTAVTVLRMLGGSMVQLATEAEGDIRKDEDRKMRRRGSMLFMKSKTSSLMNLERCKMDDDKLYKIDDYVRTQQVYGIDMGEKVFWEGYVVPNDITREKGSRYDSGRPSMPEFQQMNVEALRNWKPDPDLHTGKPDPRPVLWHADCGEVGKKVPENFDPMSPLGLLMAYEDEGRVVPVVSDFDCFLLGTRGVSYREPLGAQELSMLST